MGFVNPAMVGRQLGRGVESLKDVVTAPIDRAKIQAAASKVPEDVAYDPLRNRLESEGILSLAVKPGGGVVDSYAPESLFRGNAIGVALDQYNLRKGTDVLSTSDEGFIKSPEGEKLEAMFGWIKEKAMPYFEKQYGSPNDPLFKAFQEGKFTPRQLASDETFLSKILPEDVPKIQSARGDMIRLPKCNNKEDRYCRSIMIGPHP